VACVLDLRKELADHIVSLRYFLTLHLKGSGCLREDRTAIGGSDTDINIDIGESDVSTRREHQDSEVWAHRTGETETKQPVRP
jgi:hypothetical protein